MRIKVNINTVFIALLFWLPLTVVGNGQEDTALKILSQQEYVDIIKKYHPTAKKVALVIQQAQAELIKSRGGFDPYLAAKYQNKDFGGINYYNYLNTELKIPTWYGIEIKAGTEQLRGGRNNPENTLGQSSYVGINIPLAKNLLMDKRRNLLKQAKLGIKQSEQEMVLQMNDLLYSSMQAYWSWAYSYKSYQLIKSIVAINQKRFGFVKSLQTQGEVAAIDTVEAHAQLYNFLVALNEAEVKLANATLEVSNYLWLDNNEPYALPEGIVPDTLWHIADFEALGQELLDSLDLLSINQHPKLQSYDYKLDALEVEQRFRTQNLLPDFTVSANMLSKGYGNFGAVDRAYLENNNKFAINFSLPLRLSEARGERNKVNLKITETEYGRTYDKLAIENKIVQATNSMQALREQIRLTEITQSNYSRLYGAEDNRFALGESSLFLVNTRENKMLDTQKKLLQLKADYYKAMASLQWAAGSLF